MLSLPDRASVEHAIASVDDRYLAGLLATRLTLSVANAVADITHYLVVHAGDEEDVIIAAAGFSPLVHPIDQCRFPDPGFHPWWDWLGDVGGWYEMVVAVGDTGFAFVLLIENKPEADAVMLELCRTYVLRER